MLWGWWGEACPSLAYRAYKAESCGEDVDGDLQVVMLIYGTYKTY